MKKNGILQIIKNSAKEDLDFFSNMNKPGRERWVVQEFLRILNLPFVDNEITSPQQSSKVDVAFRDAQFQVKEITNPDLRRGREAKDKYNSLKEANSLEEITLPLSIAQDIPPYVKAYDLIVDKATELSLSNKYIELKNHIDLIFYITRERTSLVQESEIFGTDFDELGWRSVSCFNTQQAVVLFASRDSPEFIQSKEHVVFKVTN